MRRIGFAVVLAVVLTLAPVTADAHQAANVPRIGFLGLASPATYGKQMEALRAGLRDQGYVEGKKTVIAEHSGDLGGRDGAYDS